MQILYNIWKNLVIQISNIGFDIVVTMTDGHSSNITLFNTKILKNSSHGMSTANEIKPEDIIFLLFDPVHIFKNYYNNWMKKISFQCPHIEPSANKKVLNPDFSHIQALYEIELSKPQKMAHKLTEKVLHPKSIENLM